MHFQRKLTWPDRLLYLIVFAILIYVVFEVRA